MTPDLSYYRPGASARLSEGDARMLSGMKTTGLSNDVVGMATTTVLQEIRPGASFESGDFVKKGKSWGGGGATTVERLLPTAAM